MDTKDYLKTLVEDIHTTIVATVDESGDPVTAAIDMMDYDDHNLYFLTAKGKDFYHRLKDHPVLALTGLKGEDTMSSISISLKGKVEELGNEKIPELFEKNSYMNVIYPTKESRKNLTVFRIYDGSGEYFDLRTKPITRELFSFGQGDITQKNYFITDKCIGCGKCELVCPQSCISLEQIPAVINQENCIHCGNCQDVCPVDAVIYTNLF